MKRKPLLNSNAVRLWCQWHDMDTASLYDAIGDDPSLVTRIERFANGLRLLKPSMMRR